MWGEGGGGGGRRAGGTGAELREEEELGVGSKKARIEYLRASGSVKSV